MRCNIPQNSLKESEKYSSDSNICQKCHGHEFLLKTDEEGRTYAVDCECREIQKSKRRLRFAELPEMFKSADLKIFNNLDAYKIPKSRDTINVARARVKDYLINFEQHREQGKGLYLYSSTKGSGKTTMAAGIANYLINVKRVQVKFAVSITILNEIRATYDKQSEYTENNLLDHLVNTEVLIIDDFGTESITNWVEEKFYHIINERNLNNKITIYTSNYALENLKYDERIKSRIGYKVFKIEFPEESVRDRLAADNEMQNRNKILQVSN